MKHGRIPETHDQQHHKQCRRAGQQHDRKDRIEHADDLVHREQRRGDVIYENDRHRPPEKRNVRQKALVDQLRRHVDEYRHYQQQKQNGEPRKKFRVGVPQIVPDDLRQVRPVIADRHHAGQKVMRRARDDAPQRNNQEGEFSEFDADDDADDRPDPGDVQQLNHHVLPFRKHDIVHAVRVADGGNGAVVRPDDAFDQLPVGKITGDQQNDTAQKIQHFTSFSLQNH